MSSYAMQFDFPPSVNHYWRRSGSRIYLSAAGQAFKDSVAKDIRSQLVAVEMLTGRLGVSIELERGDRTEYDIDNYIKSVLDAMQGVLFENDSQVDMLIVKRGPVEKPGRCEVIVSEL